MESCFKRYVGQRWMEMGEAGFVYGRDVDVMLCNKDMKFFVFVCNAVDV